MRPIRTLKGFTLIELLLGLAIAAIIGTAVYNMFWSGVRLDHRMRHIYDDYLEVLLADQALTHDLENAVSLDLSASYPDAVIFDGQKDSFSFIEQTPSGLKRISYYSSSSIQGKGEQSFTGRIINPGRSNPLSQSPVEFLLRQESSLTDWLNETNNNTTVQVVTSKLKKGSFSCQYAPSSKDLPVLGAKALDYQDSWDKGLPLVVSCGFALYDPGNVQPDLIFQRDIFLAPLAG